MDSSVDGEEAAACSDDSEVDFCCLPTIALNKEFSSCPTVGVSVLKLQLEMMRC